MITAKIDGELINCYDGTILESELRQRSSNGEIVCPACGGRYEYCNGEFVSAYFRHKAKEECDRFAEPETEEHSLGKRKLYEWVRQQDGVSNAVLEGWIPETRQRPDIMFTYCGRKYVIEYQCTPIAKEWVERTTLYESAGIKSIWILGTKNYLWYQDQSNTKSKRFKKIEEANPLYFDSSFDILLCGDSAIKTGFRYSFDNSTMVDLLECVGKWGVGTLSEKIDLCCANLQHFKFEGKLIHDVSKNERYSKVLNRLVSLKREIHGLCADQIEDSFSGSSFKWKSGDAENLNLSGRWTGEFTVRKKIGNSEFPMVMKFTVWYSLTKCGMNWRTSISLGHRTFEAEYMPTNALRVYLAVALPIRVRQILRCLYDNPDGCGKKRKSVEMFDPSKPYEYNKYYIPDYMLA